MDSPEPGDIVMRCKSSLARFLIQDPGYPGFEHLNRYLTDADLIPTQELHQGIDSHLISLGITLMPCLLQPPDVLPGILHYIQIPPLHLLRLFYVSHYLIHRHSLNTCTQQITPVTVCLYQIIRKIHVLLVFDFQ